MSSLQSNDRPTHAQPLARNATENILLASGLPLVFRLNEDLPLNATTGRYPQMTRTEVNSLTVFQKEALVTSARSGQTWRMASDEGKYLMGHDAAPAPLAYLTVGMVASYMNEVLALAKMRGIVLDDIKLVQDNFYSMKGSMRSGTMKAGANHVNLHAVIKSEVKQSELNQLILDAVAASPLNGLMRGEKESLFTLTHNGHIIAPDKALPLMRPVVERLQANTVEAQNVRPQGEDIVVRGGLTLKSDLTDSYSGSSLTDEQNRLLHLRGICTLREDGVKKIEQQLFNPHGSIFNFLSDEGSQDGGQGRAPDAASYISAGIGFCFMTQFGRFAKMQNSKLKQYNIVQDAFFSLGGGSGGTGKAGAADPLETHVFLSSSEDDDFARNILDMSEQTCFLHAFCRTDLKVKIRISRV